MPRSSKSPLLPVERAASLGDRVYELLREYLRSGEVPSGQVVVAGGSPPRDLLLDVTLAAALAVTIGTFFFVQPLVDLATDAIASLPL